MEACSLVARFLSCGLPRRFEARVPVCVGGRDGDCDDDNGGGLLSLEDLRAKNVGSGGGAPSRRFRPLPRQQVDATFQSLLDGFKTRPARTPRPIPAAPARPRTAAPSLPDMVVLKECYVSAASPHPRCSACDVSLEGRTVFSVLDVTPRLSLCQNCIRDPTQKVAALLLGSAMVQKIQMHSAADGATEERITYQIKLRQIAADLRALAATIAANADDASKLLACAQDITALATNADAAGTMSSPADSSDSLDLEPLEALHISTPYETTTLDGNAEMSSMNVDATGIVSFTIQPKSVVTLAGSCATCGARHDQNEGDSHRTPFLVLCFNPCLRWDPGFFVTWRCTCDSAVTIYPGLEKLAQDGYWPVRVAHNGSGTINTAYGHAILARIVDMSLASTARMVSHTSLKSDMLTRVLLALDMGLDVEVLSAPVLGSLLKSILMYRRVHDAMRLQHAKRLNLGACLPCSKVPCSKGGGHPIIILDACYKFAQRSTCKVHIPDADDAALRSDLQYVLSTDELAHSHSLTCQASISPDASVSSGPAPYPMSEAPSPESGTSAASADASSDAPKSELDTPPVLSSSAHGDRAEPGLTGDACTSADCAHGAKHGADRPLNFTTLPFDYDPATEEGRKSLCYATGHCRHISVLAAALSPDPENYTLMMALIDHILNDPAYSPARISNAAWPELLRDKLFTIGIYDIGCRFGLLFEQRWHLRHGREATEKLRQAFRARAQLPSIAEAEPSSGTGPEPREPDRGDAGTAKPPMPSTIISTPGCPVDYFGWGVGAFHIYGHIFRCQVRYGQYKVLGTGLVQGDGAEVFNKSMDARAAISRPLGPAQLAASLDCYIHLWNAERQRKLVAILAQKVAALHAKMVDVETATQQFDEAHAPESQNHEFTDEQITLMRETVMKAAFAAASKPITPDSPSTAALRLLAAKRRHAALLQVRLTNANGAFPMDAKFDPESHDVQPYLTIFAGMSPISRNKFDELKPRRLDGLIKGASEAVRKAEAALTRACRTSASEEESKLEQSGRSKTAIAKSITLSARSMQVAVLERAEVEAEVNRLAHVKEWLLIVHKRLVPARASSAKDKDSAALKRAFADVMAHCQELVCMFNACLATMVLNGERDADVKTDASSPTDAGAKAQQSADAPMEEPSSSTDEPKAGAEAQSADVPMDICLLDSPDFDMSAHIRLHGAVESVVTDGLSFAMQLKRVHLADMRLRCEEELVMLGEEIKHVSLVLQYIERELESAIKTYTEGKVTGNGDGCLIPNNKDKGLAFIAWRELAAIRKLRHAHRHTFANWTCVPSEEDEARDGPDVGSSDADPSADPDASAAQDAYESDDDSESDSVIDLCEVPPVFSG